VQTALTSVKPGKRSRSPAMAASRPPTRTPRKSPSRCVREKNGPGCVRVASASISGASRVAQGHGLELGGRIGRRLGDHLRDRIAWDDAHARQRFGRLGLEEGRLSARAHERG
jgi:hypothetical protein